MGRDSVKPPLSWKHSERREAATGEDHQCIMGDNNMGRRPEGRKRLGEWPVWPVWLPMAVMKGDDEGRGQWDRPSRM